ncbi:MAG: hypothetical protein WAW07_11480 [Bacteroidales bacterium]
MEINPKQNLGLIVRALQHEHNMKLTHIAKAIGFTTTTQLHNAMGATSGISANAIIGIIANLNVNPTFLFFGKGEMFLTDESELEAIQKEKSEWERKFFGLQDELFKCKAELERAVNRYNKLIDITSIALDKTQKPDNSEETTSKE